MRWRPVYGICSAGGQGADDRGHERRPGHRVVDAARAELAAGGVRERQDHREVPGGADAGAENAIGLASLAGRAGLAPR
jgi:hypothetical protein